MTLQKQKLYRSKEYLNFVRTLPCCICHVLNETIVAHHTKTVGAGGGDDTCIPLCAYHHNAYHNYGCETFEEFYKVKREQLVDGVKEKWEER